MNISDLLGIELPLIQAPMAGVQGSALAIAVSNAGGLGSLPCAMLSAAALRSELEAIQCGTAKPYNVNFFCHAPPVVDPEKEKIWRQTLMPYYKELGIDSQNVIAGAERTPFSHRVADIVEEFKPPVVSFHFGLPAADLLRRVKDWGAKVVSSATTVDEAIWLEIHGADAIIAQGLEAGGHRGMFLTDYITTQMGIFALLPQIIRRVQVPVIAAGGIAGARAISAAMALGASGVQIGTAYLLAHEATISSVHRQALKSGLAVHTALTNLFSGRPARGIVNRLMQELGPISDKTPAFPLASTAVSPLRTKAEAAACGDFSPLWAGQNTSGCVEAPAGEITRVLAQGFKAR
jgi:nitronate monooxygenase